MSLESALIISLKRAITWDAALAPELESGALKVVDPVVRFNAMDYARRDRELAYRDLINAAAVVEVSLEISSVWNAGAIRPFTQGAITSELPLVPEDVRSVNSHVVHVTDASVPYEAANVTDRDLAGRDALIYESLARVCETFFADPPIPRIDPEESLISDVLAWSNAEGETDLSHIATALPLNRDLFKQPDQYLAERDNQIAAYASRLIQVLKNPFEFATRLYVQVEGLGEREPDVYTLIRVPYVAGTAYEIADEVWYQTSWYRALMPTENLPTFTDDWEAIASPTRRIWTAEPALPERNRIVYDTGLKTLQWFRESGDYVHIPQLYAMEIPGIFSGQTLRTLGQIPQRKDSQYWRLKAGRISYPGLTKVDMTTVTDTRASVGGIQQVDAASLTVPDQLSVIFSEGTIQAGRDYRVSLLVQPSTDVSVYGETNVLAVEGTNHGATFDGIYAPTTSPVAPGEPVRWRVPLPAGAWQMTLDYTNLSGAVASFGVQVVANPGGPSIDAPVAILEDTLPLPFVDSASNPLPNGYVATSQPINLEATGGLQDIDITWTYGGGLFHVKQLNFQSSEIETGRFAVSAALADGAVIVSNMSGTSTLDVVGANRAYEVMPFEFSAQDTVNGPYLSMSWSADGALPLKVHQGQLQEIVEGTATPDAGGFESWRGECLERAGQSVQQAHKKAVAVIDPLPVLLTEGSLWDLNSTEAYMSLLEVYEPRLREVDSVPSGSITDSRQYEVVSGSVVYLGGTYAAGETFYGTNIASTYEVLLEEGSIKQIGAFKQAGPGHVGYPGLVPDGIYFDATAGTISTFNTTADSVPQIAVLQPWMISAGLYVAQPEFISPD